MRFHVSFIFLMVHMLSMTRSGQVDLISFVKSSNVHFLMWWFIKFIIASSISIIELDKVNQSLDSFLISFFSLLLVGWDMVKELKPMVKKSTMSRNFSNFNWNARCWASSSSSEVSIMTQDRMDGFDGSNSSSFKLEREHNFFSDDRSSAADNKWIRVFFLTSFHRNSFNVKFSTSGASACCCCCRYSLCLVNRAKKKHSTECLVWDY